LIQSGFTPESARRVASVYIENIRFTNLNNSGIKSPSDTKSDEIKFARGADIGHEEDRKPEFQGKKVLATYSVPLGQNEVQIVFTGEQLYPEDFDALADYVALFKKQFLRKVEADAFVGAKSMKDVAINLANATGQNVA